MAPKYQNTLKKLRLGLALGPMFCAAVLLGACQTNGVPQELEPAHTPVQISPPAAPQTPTSYGTLIVDGTSEQVALDHFNFSGTATLILPDGTRQQGSWLDGKLHGYAEVSTAQSTYQGYWQYGQRHGEGSELTATGFTFQGAWEQDRKQGYGKLTYPNQTFYEGMWHQGKRQGFGLEQRPDRSGYKGEWQLDQRHGVGTASYPDGTSIKGRWQADKLVGIATLTTPTGAELRGEVTDGVIHTGILNLTDGSTFNGTVYQADTQHYTEAILTWLQDTAHQNSAHAQYLLAKAHLQAQIDQPNARAGLSWLSRSAEQNFVAAQFELATLVAEQDWSRAQPLLESAARQNHPGANALLAEYHHHGFHYPRDLTQAVAHYQAAIDGGSLSALNNYAWLLATTTSVYADAPEAARLIRPLVLFLNNWQLLDTFAASQARQGNFQLATRLQSEAVADAERVGTPDEIRFELEDRLSLYQQEQPFLVD